MEHGLSIRRSILSRLERAPGIARLLLIPPRALAAAQSHRITLKNLVKWAVTSRETTNLTYDITDKNKEYLAWFLSATTGGDKALAEAYIRELEEDSALRIFLRNAILRSPFRYKTDAEPRYGRRLGWYALVRMKKPTVVVETGTDKGLGSVIMAAALSRNADEGYPGRLYTIDINPTAGWLLREPYSRHAEFLGGDSLSVLASFNQQIDIFVNDSDHSAPHEWAEYEAVAGKLSPGSLVIGDNSHSTTKLLEFAEKTGRKFLFFKEEPKDHWYPGAGIGAAFD